jgi:hypothetical protein
MARNRCSIRVRTPTSHWVSRKAQCGARPKFINKTFTKTFTRTLNFDPVAMRVVRVRSQLEILQKGGDHRPIIGE